MEEVSQCRKKGDNWPGECVGHQSKKVEMSIHEERMPKKNLEAQVR